MNLLISGLNTIGNACDYPTLAKVISPIGLGVIGTKFIGTGMGNGIVQGSATVLIHYSVIIPGRSFIRTYTQPKTAKTSTPDAAYLTPNAIRVLKIAGTAVEIFGPPIVTAYCGKHILDFAARYAPGAISHFLIAEPSKAYTVANGLLAAIVPSMLQIAIEVFTEGKES